MDQGFVLELLPARGLDQSMLLPVLIGLLVVLFFTEVFGWVFAGAGERGVEDRPDSGWRRRLNVGLGKGAARKGQRAHKQQRDRKQPLAQDATKLWCEST